MSDAIAITIPRLLRVRRVQAHARRQALALVIVTVVVSAITLALTKTDYRYLAAPVLAMVNFGSIYVAILWNRDRRLPVFEIGTLWVASAIVYSAFPFLGFMAMGLQWSAWGDNRLFGYDFDVLEIASFGWRYVVYLASFIVVYLVIRGRKSARSTPLKPVSPQLVGTVILILFMQYAFKWGMAYGYGLNLEVPYTELRQLAQRMAETPLLLLQVTFIILAAVLLAKQAVMLMIIQSWRSLKWRFVLVAWLAIEVMTVVIRKGGRGVAVLLLLTFAVFYDRFVKPLRAKWVVIGGTLLLSGFLVQGHLRGFMTLRDLTVSNVLTTGNEFQSLFATAFDIYQRKKLETLGPVPWQVYASDLYILIPQQLLPFEKIDPSVWYLEVLGARDTGVGFMFGVMSQAVLGLDWLELAFRGALLGALFAGLHRWYVRHARSFWATLFYLFVAIWSYYTFRATSFWFMHFIVYQFIPVIVVAKTIEYTLSHWSSSKKREAAA